MRLGDLEARPTKLGDLEPVPLMSFGGGRSRGAGGGGALYQGPEDEPLEPVAHPFEPIFWAPGLRATGLAGAAITGASGAGAAGALEDIAARRNPLPRLPGNVAAGAALGPLAQIAGRGVRRAFSRPPTASAAAPAVARPATPLEPKSPAPAPSGTEAGGPPLPQPRPAPAPPLPPRQPFTGESAQQQTAPTRDMFAEIQRSPEYLRRLNELGGGRVQTNSETVAAAMREGPMSLDEIASWPAERPINTVTQTRALVAKDFLQQEWRKAIESGNATAARTARAELARIEPGIQNLRATGPRATQAQAMFVQDRLTQEMEALADMQDKGIPFDQMRTAIGEAKRRIAADVKLAGIGQRVKSWVEALETYATAAKLTSPVTHGVNFASNALTFLLTRPGEKTLKAGVLAAQGKPTEALGSLQALYGTTAGLRDGLRRWSTTLMDDAIDTGKAEVRRGLPLKGKWRVLDPFRHLAAADAFARGVLEDSELHQKAFASAYGSGLRGKALAEGITKLKNDPPTTWLAGAKDYAKEYTLQEDPGPVLSKIIGAIRAVPGLRLMVPFILTPSNIVKFQVQRSPLGVLSQRNIKGVAGGGEAQAEAVARLAMGAGMAAGAWSLINSIEATGAYPKSSAERALWVAEGRQPWSIRVGGRWMNYNRLQPAGLYLGQAISLKQALDAGDEKGAGAIFSRMVASGGRQVFDLPFVSGMSSILDAIEDPERSGTKVLGQTLSGTVPNILRDVRVQTDPIRREVRGVLAPTVNMIPGLSQRLPPKIDVLGREVRYDPSRTARASKVLSAPTENAATRTMRTTLETRQAEEKPPMLSPADKTKYDTEMGQARARGIEIATSQPGHKALSPERQADAVDKAVNYQRRIVNARWRNRRKSR